MRLHPLPRSEIQRVIRGALEEDLGTRGDVTTQATIPSSHRSAVDMRFREPGVLSGIQIAAEVFRELDPHVKIQFVARDGQRIRRGQVVMKIRGRTASMLTAERTALNIVQHLSGIATLTQKYRSRLGTAAKRVVLLDTRKTIPLLRRLEKYAVACGGGCNHRMGLHDAILIKDNHLAALRNMTPHPLTEAIRRVRRHSPKRKITVECDHLSQVREALNSKVERILLDNMSPRIMRQAIRWIAGRAEIEVSGGIHLGNIRSKALQGVQFISIGALTHSAPALDVGLDEATDE